MGSSLLLIGTVAIALVLWIYATRLLRQMYRKSREDLRRTAGKTTLPPQNPPSFSEAHQWMNRTSTPGGNPW
jgi:hypothetical protein